jgi:hypothetical protein
MKGLHVRTTRRLDRVERARQNCATPGPHVINLIKKSVKNKEKKKTDKTDDRVYKLTGLLL